MLYAKQQMTGTKDKILDIFFPRRCPVCFDAVDRLDRNYGGLCCTKCYPKIRFVTAPVCFRCGRGISEPEKEYCCDCRRKKRNFESGVALLDYSHPVSAHIIMKLKYANGREYADFLAIEAVRRLGRQILDWQAECIIPVPIHISRRRSRGYNQAEVLAKRLGRLLELPVETGALRRIHKTKAQKELSVWQRQQNLNQAFTATKKAKQYQRVILLDDIFTTGTTAYACTKALKEAGVSEVFLVNFSIGRGNE